MARERPEKKKKEEKCDPCLLIDLARVYVHTDFTGDRRDTCVRSFQFSFRSIRSVLRLLRPVSLFIPSTAPQDSNVRSAPCTRSFTLNTDFPVSDAVVERFGPRRRIEFRFKRARSEKERTDALQVADDLLTRARTRKRRRSGFPFVTTRRRCRLRDDDGPSRPPPDRRSSVVAAVGRGTASYYCRDEGSTRRRKRNNRSRVSGNAYGRTASGRERITGE